MAFQLGSTLLDACVLSALSGGETYGYLLTQRIKSVMEISESTLYPVLRRLQKENLLATYDQPYAGRLRRYYAITPEGRAVLARYREEWQDYCTRINSLLLGEEQVTT